MAIYPRLPTEEPGFQAEDPEMLDELPDTEKITIDFGCGQSNTFTGFYLLAWVHAEAVRGIPLNQILVSTMRLQHREVPVRLTNEIWRNNLLRGPFKDYFIKIWRSLGNDMLETSEYSEYLERLFENYAYLKNNAKLLIQDLKGLHANKSEIRIASIKGPLFIGRPYFSSKAATAILAMPFESDNLKGSIKRFIKGIADEDKANGSCAYHELADLLLRAFSWSWDSIRKENLELEKTQDQNRRRDLLLRAFGWTWESIIKEDLDSENAGNSSERSISSSMVISDPRENNSTLSTEDYSQWYWQVHMPLISSPLAFDYPDCE